MASILNQDKRFETLEHTMAIEALIYDKKMVGVAIAQIITGTNFSDTLATSLLSFSFCLAQYLPTLV